MKAKITKKVTLDITIDGSEAVMFNQGGMHKVILDQQTLNSLKNLDKNTIVEITVQIERQSQFYANWVQEEAYKAKAAKQP